MDFASAFHSILQNQVVTGLSFTALLGGAAYQLRAIPHLIRDGLLRFFTVNMTVMSSDPAFDWIDHWLAQQPYARTSKMMRLKTIETSVPDYDVAQAPQEWALAPGPGNHLLWWQGRPVLLERSLLSKDTVNSRARTSKPLEQLHFRTVGRSQATMRRLVAEARRLAHETETVPVRIWGDYAWEEVRGRNPRPLGTIILRDGQRERIVGDIQWFLGARDWYDGRGIPFRRGYVFAGPPGTGKTSIVLGLASYFNRPICVLNLSSVENDNLLFAAMRFAPLNAIILIEDIDCAFPAHARERAEDKDKEPAGGISKAGLLNALDGITTPDGRIFVMTTNFPERLDAALIRPGRADVHETFHYFDAAEQRRMAARFYDHFEPLPFPVSPAEMQAAFMQFPDNAEGAHAYLDAKCSRAVAPA